MHSEEKAASATTRRTVLKLAGAGATAAILGRALQMEALAYDVALQEGLLTLRPSEAEAIQAIGARLWPGSPEDPGAREAGTVFYIDRALAGPEATHLAAYRSAVPRLNAATNKLHGDDFIYLDEDKQDEVVAALEKDSLAGFTGGRAFFDLIRRHTMEGLFSDPIYGGNRDFVGWKAVGYPGPFYFITAEEQQSFLPLDMPYQSIVDL